MTGGVYCAGNSTDISALLLPGATVLHDRWDCNQLRLWLCVQARGHPSNVCIPALMIDHLYFDMRFVSRKNTQLSKNIYK